MTYLLLTASLILFALAVGWLLGKRKPKWKPKSGDWAYLTVNGRKTIIWIVKVQDGDVYYCFYVKGKDYACISDMIRIRPMKIFLDMYEPCDPSIINRPDYLK